jgi:ABC-type transport system substrate-binding protein
MEKFKREYDERKRQPYADLVQNAIAREVPTSVLWVNEDVYAYNSDLTGFHPNQVSQFDDFVNVDI